MNFNSYNEIKKELLNWSKKADDSIFVIDGPFGSGKTHLVNSFLNEIKIKHIYINVRSVKEVLQNILNSTSSNPEDFYSVLCFRFNKDMYRALTILVFDEIEYLPELRQYFKTLNKLDYIKILAISCGALGTAHYGNLLIPSEEDIHYLFPMTFEEFLFAVNQVQLANYTVEHIVESSPISEYLSSQLYGLYSVYTLVGGYPNVVSEFLRTKDIRLCIKMNKLLLDQQLDHFLSVTKIDKDIVNDIHNNLLMLVGKNKYNFFSDISIYRMKQYIELLSEEYILNVPTGLDVMNTSDVSSSKRMYLSHPCFYTALSDEDEIKDYFNGKRINQDVVLTDYYFNQARDQNPLHYLICRSKTYFQTDALYFRNQKAYVVEYKNRRLVRSKNISISALSEDEIKPGIILFNGNVFSFGDVSVLPSYCSCFIKYLDLNK